MRNKLISVLTALVLVLSFSLIPAIPVMANGTTYYVATTGSDETGNGSETNPWATIQHAVDECVGGDTINVGAGIYREHISIDKSNLKLIGENKETTIIDATQDPAWTYPKPGIVIGENYPPGGTVSGVTVSGFSIRDAALKEGGTYWDKDTTGPGMQALAGILIYNSSNNTIENNILDNNHWQVFVCAEWPTAGYTECKDNRIASNILRNSKQDGIYLYSDGGVFVQDTEIIDNEINHAYGETASGIEFWGWPEGGDTPTISGTLINGNLISGCTYGVRIREDVSDVAGTSINLNDFADNSIQVLDATETLNIQQVLDANTFDRAVTVDHPGASLLHTIWSSIQDGVDAALAGDTISVAAGTYDEQLTIGKNLMVTGAGAGNSIVQPTGATANIGDVTITSAGGGTVVRGFTFDFNGTDGTRTGQGIWVSVPNVQIRNNTFLLGKGVGNGSLANHVSPGFGVLTTGGDVAGLLIDGNSFVGISTATPTSEGSLGVWLSVSGNSTSPLTVSNNAFSGPLYAGVEVVASYVRVVSNNLTGPSNVLGTYGIGGSGTLTNITVERNSIKTFGTAVDFRSGAITATITNNTLSNNGEGVYASGTPALTVNFNNITGNTAGVINDSLVRGVDATNNWWGNASGPVWAGMDYDIAYGDTVSDYVDYQPWLLAEVVPDVMPTTYNFTLALKDGWTLASTDKEVTTGTAWVGTDVLADTATILAYKYTAGTGYAQVTLATQLTSVDAYYIKTDGGGGIGIKYSTAQPGVVTKTLGEGWNIVSSAVINNAGAVLSPLRYVQIGNQQGVGLTTVSSQGSYNQFTDSFYVATFGDQSWVPGSLPPALTSITLNPYDGYWVYMNAAKIFGVIPD